MILHCIFPGAELSHLSMMFSGFRSPEGRATESHTGFNTDFKTRQWKEQQGKSDVSTAGFTQRPLRIVVTMYDVLAVDEGDPSGNVPQGGQDEVQVW